jgi:uncharacterized membrane protein
MVVIGAIICGQFSSKTGANALAEGNRVGYLYVAFGYGFLALRGIVWLMLLRMMELSKAYPLQSVSYVLVIAMSFFIFNEQISTHQLIGCGLIIAGSLVVYTE